uniref:Uncharacterized protein n=1 Tax=Hyaloperonospora arabidopsidis (strain Emoy2) TaxID=559515 RepID=M4C2E4_HYAAE
MDPGLHSDQVTAAPGGPRRPSRAGAQMLAQRAISQRAIDQRAIAGYIRYLLSTRRQ